MKNRRYVMNEKRLWVVVIAATMSLAGLAQADGADNFGKGNLHLGGFTGGSFSLQRYGGARDLDHVASVPLVLGLGVGISDPVGDSFLQGNFEIRVEGLAVFQTAPHSGFGGGGVALLRYNFLTFDDVVPFMTVGVGALGIDYGLRSQRDGFAFSVQGGVGAHVFLSDRFALTGEFRYQHTSNLRTRMPNGGLDMGTFLVGGTVFFGTRGPR